MQNYTVTAAALVTAGSHTAVYQLSNSRSRDRLLSSERSQVLPPWQGRSALSTEEPVSGSHALPGFACAEDGTQDCTLIKCSTTEVYAQPFQGFFPSLFWGLIIYPYLALA